MTDGQHAGELDENLREIVVHSPLPMAILDRGLRYLLHSKRYLEAYHLDQEDLIGRHHYEVFPELPQRYRDVHQRCLAGATESGREDPFVRMDGRTEWTNWDARPWRLASGEIGGIVVMTEVITARKEAELELQQTNRRLAEAQRVARIGYWEWDAVKNRLDLSDEVYRLIGLDPEKKIQTYEGYIAAVSEDVRIKVPDRVRASVLAGEPFHFEHTIVESDEPNRIVGIHGRVVRDSQNKMVSLVGAAQDVTEQRTLEEHLRESQKLEATGRLAGGVAHDFNNILTAIFSFSEFALTTLQTGHAAAEDILEVIRAAEQAKTLTQQLLAFSRRQTVIPRVLRINDRVRRVESMMRRILGEDIRYSTHLDENLWSTRIDPNALEQVIVNLGVNARDAMPDGGRLTIETANISLDEEEIGAKGQRIAPGDYVAFILSDEGEGMSDDVQGRIFEPFFTTKAPGRGTGLGLSTCYGIVRQAEGFMWAYSEVGQGTTFKVYLPRVRDAVEAETPVAQPTAVGGDETILLAEDNVQVRKSAVRTLQGLGFRVLAGASAEQALETVANLDIHVDLLITDIVMPGMNGKQLADIILARYPRACVLFMSGYTENTIVHHGVLEQGVELLQKPFSPSGLGIRVRQVLDAAAKRSV